MTDTIPQTHADALDQTLGALNGGLTGIQPSKALALVEHWRAECAKANLDTVADGLGVLHGALQADRLDGSVIGASLRSLSESTAAAASGASEVGPSLERLGALLARGARVLGA